MKLRIAIHFVLMGLFAFVGPAFAQTGDAVKTEIPFDFYVGTHKMTAGTYFISLDQATHRVDITGGDENDRAFLIGTATGPEQESEPPSLEFDHVANDYFLKGVKTPDLSLGFDVDKQEQQITGISAGNTMTARLAH
jgi:hypothetical protein